MSDSPSTVWEIWKALLIRSFSQRNLLLNLLILAGFGFLVPWRWGFDFYSPMVIVSYTAVALLIAASTAADLLGVTSPALPFVPVIMVSAIHSTALLIAIYGLGMGAVNLAVRAPRFLHPNWKLTGAALLFALCGSLFAAAATATLMLLFSAGVARNTVRIVFLALLLGIVFGKSRLPLDWQFEIDRRLTTSGITSMAVTGSLVAGVLASVLIVAFRRR